MIRRIQKGKSAHLLAFGNDRHAKVIQLAVSIVDGIGVGKLAKGLHKAKLHLDVNIGKDSNNNDNDNGNDDDNNNNTTTTTTTTTNNNNNNNNTNNTNKNNNNNKDKNNDNKVCLVLLNEGADAVDQSILPDNLVQNLIGISQNI
jgi:hypothetical protein